MKADFNAHEGTFLMYPFRKDVWRDGAIPISKTVAELAAILAQYEPVNLGLSPSVADELLSHEIGNSKILPMQYDDIWVRDSGAVPVGDHLVKFGFNAWGGEDGLCCEWEKDSTVPEQMSALLSKRLEISPLTLEGGALATDGCGTILAVKDTILCDSRNPQMSEEEINSELLHSLDAKRIIWLDHGIAYDETGGHIDNLCAFADTTTVLLAWTDDIDNPSYSAVRQAENVLVREGYDVVKIPLPSIFERTDEDCKGIVYADGSKPRLVGEPIQPSYINFVFANGAVIVPMFGDEMDDVVLDIFAHQFPDRDIVPFPAREIVLGGGGLHCITKNY